MRIRFPVLSETTTRLAGAVCLASLVAGCSSGVSRFNEDMFTGSVPAPVGGPQATVAGAPAPSQPYPSAPSVDQTRTGSTPQTYRQAPAVQPVDQQVERHALRTAPAVQPDPGVQLATVPEPTDPTATPSVPTPSHATRSTAAAAQQVAAVTPQTQPVSTQTVQTAAVAANGGVDGWTSTGGTRVTIAPGETIFNLSRRYGVPASEILKTNGISDPSKIKTGQVIVIPTYVYSRKAPVSAPDNNPKTRFARSSTGYQGQADPNNVPVPSPKPQRQVAVLPTTPVQREADSGQTPAPTVSPEPSAQTASNAQPAARSGSVYTVQAGDSLNRIASKTGVSVSALKQANGLDGSVIRIGQKLTIPGAVDTVQTASVPKQTKTLSAKPKSQPNVSVADQAKVQATAPKTTGIGKLRWPAKGQVMTGFGGQNDGIDISLPAGTPIKAAENGVVIYSGNGLKEYGNTILVRHENGLVTVYGHASELVVKRGDNVSRGQVVAVSGMSGEASRPKLHFEIRKDAKPVDPLAYLE